MSDIFRDFDKKNEVPKVKIPKFATGGICDDAIFFNLDVDFSNSDISGVMFDMNSLRGIVVDEFQCKSLITMFGVNVK